MHFQDYINELPTQYIFIGIQCIFHCINHPLYMDKAGFTWRWEEVFERWCFLGVTVSETQNLGHSLKHLRLCKFLLHLQNCCFLGKMCSGMHTASFAALKKKSCWQKADSHLKSCDLLKSRILPWKYHFSSLSCKAFGKHNWDKRLWLLVL